jgi:hypothetical protein
MRPPSRAPSKRIRSVPFYFKDYIYLLEAMDEPQSFEEANTHSGWKATMK